MSAPKPVGTGARWWDVPLEATDSATWLLIARPLHGPKNFEMREIIASNRCGDPDKATSDGDGPMAAIIRQLPSAKPLVTLLCIHAVKQAPRLEVGVGEAFGSKNEVRSG